MRSFDRMYVPDCNGNFISRKAHGGHGQTKGTEAFMKERRGRRGLRCEQGIRGERGM